MTGLRLSSRLFLHLILETMGPFGVVVDIDLCCAMSCKL